MNIKNVCFILLLFIGCNGNLDTKEISDQDISNSINYVLDSLIAKRSNNNFTISSTFCDRLSESTLYNDIINIDSFLTHENVLFMQDQYRKLQGYELKPYIKKEYNNNIVNDFNENDLIYFEISPPLFSSDKSYFVLYAISIFNVNNQPKWDDIYYVFEKENNFWKLHGMIKSSK